MVADLSKVLNAFTLANVAGSLRRAVRLPCAIECSVEVRIEVQLRESGTVGVPHQGVGSLFQAAPVWLPNRSQSRRPEKDSRPLRLRRQLVIETHKSGDTTERVG